MGEWEVGEGGGGGEAGDLEGGGGLRWSSGEVPRIVTKLNNVYFKRVISQRTLSPVGQEAKLRAVAKRWCYLKCNGCLLLTETDRNRPMFHPSVIKRRCHTIIRGAEKNKENVLTKRRRVQHGIRTVLSPCPVFVWGVHWSTLSSFFFRLVFLTSSQSHLLHPTTSAFFLLLSFLLLLLRFVFHVERISTQSSVVPSSFQT